jgi:RimJ/RimL family protein N-acetyltransferase
MLRGELTGLRARQDSDIEVFETELLNDVETWVRADGRPWRPVTPGSADSPYRAAADRDDTVMFSAVELPAGKLAGEALLWGIDLHNRNAHLGLSLRPEFRGKHLGTDIVRVLCHYGFAIRGLYRLQVDTLADNGAMIGAAIRAGFVLEGTLRQCAWVNGSFADQVVLGQLATEWRPAGP